MPEDEYRTRRSRWESSDRAVQGEGTRANVPNGTAPSRTTYDTGGVSAVQIRTLSG